MSSLRSPEDVVNDALVRIGWRIPISNLYEGSVASDAALKVYAQTRDAVLRVSDWGFAEKIVAGVVAGVAAPFPWTSAYTYPADCLRLRNMFGAAYTADTNNPVRILYTIANDSAAAKVIWAKAAGVTLVYTARITDPAKWEPLFAEMLAIELGKKLVATMQDGAKIAEADEKMMIPAAEGTVG